jgi:hypothetical protein
VSGLLYSAACFNPNRIVTSRDFLDLTGDSQILPHRHTDHSRLYSMVYGVWYKIDADNPLTAQVETFYLTKDPIETSDGGIGRRHYTTKTADIIIW